MYWKRLKRSLLRASVTNVPILRAFLHFRVNHTVCKSRKIRISLIHEIIVAIEALALYLMR